MRGIDAARHFARLLLAAVLLTGPAAAAGDSGELLALVGATVIDGTRAAPLEDAVLLLEGERIAAVGARDAIDVPERARVVELEGR